MRSPEALKSSTAFCSPPIFQAPANMPAVDLSLVLNPEPGLPEHPEKASCFGMPSRAQATNLQMSTTSNFNLDHPHSSPGTLSQCEVH